MGEKKILLYCSLFLNLGVLAFFKYADFLSDTLYGIMGLLGFEVSHTQLNIILPIGISFYTFQSMSYTIDMYRKKYKPYDSILDFSLYIMFFPQLIAGPIVRANTIQKTLNSKRIRTAPLWLLRFVGAVGDVMKIIFKFDPPLTSFRLNNMLKGGVYPVENTKDIIGELPYDLKESVYLTAKWMYDDSLIIHKPSRI